MVLYFLAHIRIGSRTGLDMNSDCVLVAAHESIGQRLDRSRLDMGVRIT